MINVPHAPSSTSHAGLAAPPPLSLLFCEPQDVSPSTVSPVRSRRKITPSLQRPPADVVPKNTLSLSCTSGLFGPAPDEPVKL